jgi:pilus assembly protein CpaC
MSLRGSQQVLLRVRIGWMSRHQINGSVLGRGVLDSMVSSGAFKTVVEPSVVAMSGESAEFVSGGQFPVVVTQENKPSSVDYKSYGVKLAFTPLVLAANRIRLSVAPEWTDLDPKGATVKKMPVVATHQVKTTVELAPGESFMIAGLVRDNQAVTDRGKGRETQELVVAVTPFVVDPVAGTDVRLPTDHVVIDQGLESLFQQQLAKKSAQSMPALHGHTGFMTE